MKSFILLFLLSVSVFSSSLFNLGGGGSTQPPQISKDQKKSYDELVSSLKNSGNGEFYFYLAIIYANGMPEPDDQGKTIQKDIDQSVLYFNKAVEAGYLQAAVIAGSLFLYNEDFIIRKDNVKTAKQFLQLAYNNNVFDAAPALADITINYDNDVESGIMMLSTCAEKGLSTCQLMIATAYFHGIDEKGFHLEKNEAIANKYLSDACLNQNKTERVTDFCNSSYVIKNK